MKSNNCQVLILVLTCETTKVREGLHMFKYFTILLIQLQNTYYSLLTNYLNNLAYLALYDYNSKKSRVYLIKQYKTI